jgi:hypothetical protein
MERLRFVSRGMDGASAMRGSWKAYGYAWVTLGFFVISLVGHWLFGWFAYVDEQLAHAQPIAAETYFIEMMRDTLENWQSEFLQLLWQVGGLAFLLFVGSPQSKEGSDRLEAKVDAILLKVSPQDGEKILADIDDAYEGRHTDEYHMRKFVENETHSAASQPSV